MKIDIKSDKVPFNTPFYYGWVIVFVSALGVFFSGPGQTYSVSVFIDSFIKDLGWSRSLVSFTYSLGTLAAGLTVPYIGRQFDRYGHRKVVPVVALFFGGALLWMSFLINPIMLFVGFYLIRLLGQSSMVIGPATIVPMWFEKKRGRALSFMTVGGMAGAAILPPLNTWIINTWNWRIGWQVWAVVIWVIMIPLAWFLLREKPEEVGLSKDGISASAEEAEEEAGKNQETEINPSAPSVTLAEARRQPVFWMLLYCMFIPSMIGTGIVFHIVSIFGEKGLTEGIAASTLSIIAIVGFPFTLIAGSLLDRIRVRYIMVATFVLYSLTMVWLINVQSPLMAVMYGIFQGIIMGFFRVNVNMLWPTYFGLEHLGNIRGVVQIAFVVGAACGPFPIGFAYDYFGGYSEILWIMTIFPVIAIVISFFAKSPAEKNIE